MVARGVHWLELMRVIGLGTLLGAGIVALIGQAAAQDRPQAPAVSPLLPSPPGKPMPGSAPERVFGYYDPTTGTFKPAAQETAAATKPQRGTLTLRLRAIVTKPDPDGSLGCAAEFGFLDIENGQAPLQDGPAETTTFTFAMPWVYTGHPGSGHISADCYAYTKYGDQRGSVYHIFLPGAPNETYFLDITLQ
jgi:hypothetical protein